MTHVDITEAQALNLTIPQSAGEARKRRYIEENREAIAAHNTWIEQQGALIPPMWGF